MSITLILVIITCLISIACFNNKSLFDRLKHFPIAENKNREYYRWLTSGFVHGDFIHLLSICLYYMSLVELLKMIWYYILVTRVERFYSYLPICSSLSWEIYLLTTSTKNIHIFASVGASGGVSGIIFIFILLYPWSLLGLFAIIPIPAILLVFYIFGIQLGLRKTKMTLLIMKRTFMEL